MSKGDAFWRKEARHAHLKQAEADGRVADSLDVRIALIKRMEAGKLTLEQVQAELRKLKCGAKAVGKVTRTQAFRGR